MKHEFYFICKLIQLHKRTLTWCLHIAPTFQQQSLHYMEIFGVVHLLLHFLQLECPFNSYGLPIIYFNNEMHHVVFNVGNKNKKYTTKMRAAVATA